MFEGWNIERGPDPERVKKLMRRPRGWWHRLTDEEREIIAMHTYHPGGSVYDPRRRESIVFDRTDGHCGYCWVKPATTIDHIKPKCHGGSNGYDNVIGACLQCNNDKGAMSLAEFRRLRGVAAFPFETYEKRNTSAATEESAAAGQRDQVG